MCARARACVCMCKILYLLITFQYHITNIYNIILQKKSQSKLHSTNTQIRLLVQQVPRLL